MELWIRSQNKRNLMKAEDIVVEDNYIEIFKQSDDSTRVGEYKTKERALEILDEIQNFIQPPMNFIVSQHIDFDNDGEGLIGCNILKEEPKIERISDIIVYQMPKE